MGKQDFTVTFSVDQTPEEVFAAINDVRSWWTGEIDGRTDVLGAEFTYSHKDIHRTTHKITELVPASRVVWHVTASHLASFANIRRDGARLDVKGGPFAEEGKALGAYFWIDAPTVEQRSSPPHARRSTSTKSMSDPS
jgi:uncharacterized protein YndB with AHSA1/START domain